METYKIDLRTKDEINVVPMEEGAIHITGVTMHNISREIVDAFIMEISTKIPPNTALVLYCASGRRANLAADIIQQTGLRYHILQKRSINTH